MRATSWPRKVRPTVLRARGPLERQRLSPNGRCSIVPNRRRDRYRARHEALGRVSLPRAASRVWRHPKSRHRVVSGRQRRAIDRLPTRSSGKVPAAILRALSPLWPRGAGPQTRWLTMKADAAGRQSSLVGRSALGRPPSPVRHQEPRPRPPVQRRPVVSPRFPGAPHPPIRERLSSLHDSRARARIRLSEPRQEDATERTTRGERVDPPRNAGHVRRRVAMLFDLEARVARVVLEEPAGHRGDVAVHERRIGIAQTPSMVEK